MKMTRDQQHAQWWKIIYAAYNNPRLHDVHFRNNNNRKGLGFAWSYMFQGISILHLHQSMFTKSINFLASEEQKARWMPLINNLNMLGCYAQTELGHGSNVAGLETTAVFDKATDEFVIHTPSIRATKFWPGSLGRCATHGVVMANLILGKQSYGVQAFLVPIRSRENHMPFAGIEVGDIGAKLGYNTVDNGYLSFNQYRVPRLSLLNRFVNVSREGEFELLGDPRLLYQIMASTRTMIVLGAASVLHRACTIATRYAACRRQFVTEKGSKRERKILDYQTHMAILGPHLANSFVTNLAGRAVEKLMQESFLECEKNNFKLLDICHHFTSGMKACCTDMSYKGTDECRQSAGGAGYHIASGLVTGFTDHAVMPTFEGVNVIMYQQSSRYVLKQVKKAKAGKKLKFNFVYINKIPELLSSKSQAKTIEDVLNLDYLEHVLKVRSAFHLETTYNMLGESKASKQEKTNDLFATDIQRMSHHHIIFIMFSLTRDAMKANTFKDPAVPAILNILLKVYALK